MCVLRVHGCRAREEGATHRLLGTSFTVRGWTASRTFLPRLAGCDSCSDPPASPSIINIPAPSTTPSDLILNTPLIPQDLVAPDGRWLAPVQGLGGDRAGGVLWVEWGAGRRESLREGLWRGGSRSLQTSKPTPVSTCYRREWPRPGLSLVQSPPALPTPACHSSLCGLGAGLAHLSVCLPNTHMVGDSPMKALPASRLAESLRGSTGLGEPRCS